MNTFTAPSDDWQPFGAVLKRAIVSLIDQADTPSDREDRIQTALDEGAITYAEAYALRCGESL